MQFGVRYIVQGSRRQSIAQIAAEPGATPEDVIKSRTSRLDRIAVVWIAVEDPESSPQHHRCIVLELVRESEPRREIVLVPIPQILARSVSIREKHTTDRVFRYPVLASQWLRAVLAEPIHPAADFVNRSFGLVAHPYVQCEARSDSPIVLKITGPILDALADRCSDPGVEIPHVSQHQVRQPDARVHVPAAVAGPAAGESSCIGIPVAGWLRTRQFIALKRRVLTPELERVVAFDPREVRFVVEIRERGDALRVTPTNLGHRHSPAETHPWKGFPALFHPRNTEKVSVICLAAVALCVVQMHAIETDDRGNEEIRAERVTVVQAPVLPTLLATVPIGICHSVTLRIAVVHPRVAPDCAQIDAPIIAEVVVDSTDVVMPVCIQRYLLAPVPVIVGYVVRHLVRFGQVAQHFHRYRIESIRGNSVVRKPVRETRTDEATRFSRHGIEDRDENGIAAPVLGGCREVSGPPFREPDTADAIHVSRVQEEVKRVGVERLVLHDRSANAGTATVLPELRLRRILVPLVVPADCIKDVVPDVVVQDAVDLVVAASSHGLHDARRAAPVLRSHRVHFNLELLHGLHRRNHLDVLHAQPAARVVDAVDERARRPRATAPDRNVAVPGAVRARHEVHEVEDVPTRQGQLHHLLVLHRRSHSPGSGLHLHLGSVDLDHFGDRADLQRERLLDLRVRVQAQALHLGPLEPVRFGSDVVLAEHHVRHVVHPVDASLRGRLNAGLGIDDRDHSPGDHGTGRVRHGAIDGSARALAPSDRGQHDQKQRNESDP